MLCPKCGESIGHLELVCSRCGEDLLLLIAEPPDADEPGTPVVAPPKRVRTRRPWMVFAITAAAVVLVAAAAYGLLVAMTVVPDVTGMTAEDASLVLADAGLTADMFYDTTAEEASGTVIGQIPEPGWRALGDAAVTLVIAGAEMLEVPDLVGMDEVAARTAIAAAGFVVGEVGQEFDAAVSLSAVISQSPSGGAQAPRGGSIDLTISEGTELIGVPDVVGMAQAEAEKALADVGLAVALQTAPSGDGAPGAVISQSPESGNAVDAGTLVTLLVRADTPIAVPNVVGMTQASAEKKLTDAGFDVRVQTAESGTVQKGSVISQSPVAGSSAEAGAVVTLRVSGGAPKVRVPNVVRMSQSRAERTLKNAGFGVRIQTASSNSVPKGDVISQSPSAGSTVDGGAVVTLRVSSGASTVQVPGVLNRSQVDAERLLRAAGLVPEAYWPGGRPDDADPAYSEVVGQSPAEGSSVPAGSVVRISLIG